MTRVVVYHTDYGCDTGCCGHFVDIVEGTVEEWLGSSFTFSHPYNEDPRAFAEDVIRTALGEEHVADLDWAASDVSNA